MFKKICLSLALVGLLSMPSWAANTLNPTTASYGMRGIDITFDGATAFDLGYIGTVVFALYMPAAAGNSIQIRDGSATAPRISYNKSIDGGPQIVYISGPSRIYVKGDQVSAGDILILRFKTGN